MKTAFDVAFALAAEGKHIPKRYRGHSTGRRKILPAPLPYYRVCPPRHPMADLKGTLGQFHRYGGAPAGYTDAVARAAMRRVTPLSATP